MSIRPYVVAQCHENYGKLLASALALEKERIGANKINDRNIIMRVGTASINTQQQQNRKRTRDDVVSPRGASQYRAP